MAFDCKELDGAEPYCSLQIQPYGCASTSAQFRPRNSMAAGRK
jgi:hypothetical protein